MRGSKVAGLEDQADEATDLGNGQGYQGGLS
jgi:hypothetical protein